MKRPAWLEKYQKPVRDQITVLPSSTIRSGKSYPTGAGEDGVIQKRNPVMRDEVEFHEGEYVVSAKDVKKMGGPEGVEKKLGIPHDKTIRRSGPVQKFAGGGFVTTDQLRGAASTDNPTGTINTVASSSLTAGANPISHEQNSWTVEMPKITFDPPASTIQAPAAAPVIPIVKQEEQVVAGAQMPGSTVQAPAAATVKPRYSGPYGGNTAGPNNTTINPPKEATTWDVAADPYTGPALDPNMGKNGAHPTIQGPAPAPTQDQALISKAQGVMAGLMDPNSETYKAIAANAFNGLAPQLQTNLTLTAMQIAQNPNMSEGAKRTMLADQIRNNGIAEYELAQDMAGKALSMVADAAKTTYDMASGNRTFDRGVLESDRNFVEGVRQYDQSFGLAWDQYKDTKGWKEFETALSLGDTPTAKAAYKALTGVDISDTALTDYAGYLKTSRSNELTMQGINITAGNLANSMVPISLLLQNPETVGSAVAQLSATFKNPDGTPMDFSGLVTAANATQFGKAMDIVSRGIDSNWTDTQITEALATAGLSGAVPAERLTGPNGLIASMRHSATAEGVAESSFPPPAAGSEGKYTWGNVAVYDGDRILPYKEFIADIAAAGSGMTRDANGHWSIGEIVESDGSDESLEKKAAVNTTWTNAAGQTMYKPASGASIPLTLGTLVVRGTTGQPDFDSRTLSYAEGNTWKSIRVGDAFTITREATRGDNMTSLPAGTYRLEDVPGVGTAYVNMQTGNRYAGQLPPNNTVRSAVQAANIII